MPPVIPPLVFTFPYILNDQFCIDGNVISPIPSFGPLAQIRRSLQIFDKFITHFFISEVILTNPSRFSLHQTNHLPVQVDKRIFWLISVRYCQNSIPMYLFPFLLLFPRYLLHTSLLLFFLICLDSFQPCSHTNEMSVLISSEQHLITVYVLSLLSHHIP